MGLEAGNYISDLNVSNPAGTDQRAEGDDHIRLIKKTLKQSFPNVNGAVGAADEDLAAMASGAFAAGANWTLESSSLRRGVDGHLFVQITLNGGATASIADLGTFPAGYRPQVDSFFMADYHDASGNEHYGIMVSVTTAGVTSVAGTVNAASPPAMGVGDRVRLCCAFATR